MREILARQIQRTDSAGHWTQQNPVLRNGEIGYESDSGRFKLGDGARAWTALPYRGGVATVNGAAPDENGDISIAGGGGHSLVVRTQTEFDAMIASPTWLDAVSVLLVGSFTYTSGDGAGIMVPDTVMMIDGIDNAEICAQNDMDFLLGYAQAPTGPGRRVTGLTLRALGDASGFRFMAGLYGCSAFNFATGFLSCTSLMDCRATPTGSGFTGCVGLVNCSVLVTRGALTTGFSNCDRLTGCSAEITRGLVSRGFDSCRYLSNCFVSIFGTSECTGYRSCSYCSCCVKGSMGANAVLWTGDTQKRNDSTCDL